MEHILEAKSKKLYSQKHCILHVHFNGRACSHMEMSASPDVLQLGTLFFCHLSHIMMNQSAIFDDLNQSTNHCI